MSRRFAALLTLNALQRNRPSLATATLCVGRKFTTSSFAYTNSNVKSFLSQIDAIAPKFKLHSDDINVLYDPKDFYETLKLKILAAKKRIFLATLYIGKSENELINTLDMALGANQDLTVYILTDALRGTREAPEKCCASLLLPLLEKFGPERVKLRMYHTPNLNGFKKKYIPHRFNEGWGLQHMKLYGFDNEIVLSGANLSQDYFTNRQDRYICFSDAKLTDYYFSLFQAVSYLSYSVEYAPMKPEKFQLVWPHKYYEIPEPTESPERFIAYSSKILSPLLKPDYVLFEPPVSSHWKRAKPQIQEKVSETKSTDDDVLFDGNPSTFVYPISQFSQILKPDVSTEFNVLSRLLSLLRFDKFDWVLTAGYFNIHPELKDKLLETCSGSMKSHASVITASPQANGFYESNGISRLLPAAYSLVAQNFLKEIQARKQDIKLYEWQNGVVNTTSGWSYHAKGIWINYPNENEPSMTVIGSSNFTRRAYSHDLESGVLLVTDEPQVKTQLAKEVQHLRKHCTQMQVEDYEKEDRKPDWRQKLFVWIFGDKM